LLVELKLIQGLITNMWWEEMGFVEEPDTVYPVNIQDISINQQVSTYLKKLKNDIFNPKIFKDENEDIGFLWEIGKFSVDVWFYSDGTYS